MDELEEIRDQIEKNAKVRLSILESIDWVILRDPDTYAKQKRDSLIGLLNVLNDVSTYDLYLEDLQRKVEHGH